MKLLSLEESNALGINEANEIYKNHFNPGLIKIYQIMGMLEMDIKSAEGVEITMSDGRKVLDFSSSIGILGLGHNHPKIIAAEQFCHKNKIIDGIKMGPHKLLGAFAYNLAQMLPDPLEISFFAVSGAEAVEAALKLCEKAQGPERKKFICMEGGYHGKTHGALSLTTSGGFQRGFLFGIPQENVITVEYGNAKAVEEAISKNPNDIIAMIVEPIQGEGVRVPPVGYLKEVYAICKKNNILTIFDEVKVGMGRTGTFCSFQREDVVPDVTTLSKALGGGKRAIGAMISSREVFEKAYGQRKDCTLHTSTFSGLGESCAVGIETLKVYHDENLAEQAKEKGEYLNKALLALQEKYPSKITEVRGMGLFQGVRFNFIRSRFEDKIDLSKIDVFNTIDNVVLVSIVRELYSKYNILTHFHPSCPDLLHIMPPLIVEKEQLDQFVAALDDILDRGFIRIVEKFVTGNLKDRIKG